MLSRERERERERESPRTEQSLYRRLEEEEQEGRKKVRIDMKTVTTRSWRLQLLPLLVVLVVALLPLEKYLGVNGHYVTCDGCDPDNRKYERVYPAWSCQIEDNTINNPVDGYGYTTPLGTNECECHYGDLQTDIIVGTHVIPNGDSGSFISKEILQRYNDYFCVLVDENQYDEAYVGGVTINGPGVQSCGCLIGDNFAQTLCPPAKCDYAYTCGDVQYNCWDMISPTDLLLDDPINTDVHNVIYCGDDLQDNPFNLIQTSYQDREDICDLDLTISTDHIDSYICPNGETLTRYTKFCAPDSPSITPIPDSNCVTCDLPFCDYGDGNEWVVTQYTAPAPLVVVEEEQETATTAVLMTANENGDGDDSRGGGGILVALGAVAGALLLCKATTYSTNYESKTRDLEDVKEEEQEEEQNEDDDKSTEASNDGGSGEDPEEANNGGGIMSNLLDQVMISIRPKASVTEDEEVTFSKEGDDKSELFPDEISYSSYARSKSPIIVSDEKQRSPHDDKNKDIREYSTITLVSAAKNDNVRADPNAPLEVQGVF